MQLGKWLVVLATAFVLNTSAHAQSGYDRAEALLLAGDTTAAIQQAHLLLSANPTDARALLILGQAQIASARPDLAARSARFAWRATRQNADLRFDVARLGARAATDAQRYGIARFWLRRAADYAADGQRRAVIRQSFTVLRQLDRSATQLSFAVTPSSNINGGSSADRLIVDDIITPLFFSGDARALSGAEIRLALRHQIRIGESSGSVTYLGFRLSGASYVLSGAAKAQAPDVTGQDFATGLAEISLSRTVQASAGNLRFGAALGQGWYGGKPDSARLRLEAQLIRPLSPDASGNLDLLIEHRRADRNGAGSTAISLAGGYDWQSSRLIGNASLTLTQLIAPARPNDAHQSATVAFSFAPQARSRLIEPKLTVSASIFQFDTVLGNVFVDRNRTDRRLALDLQLDLPRAERFGFVPAVTISGGRTWSNVSRYDRSELSAAFSLVSAF